MWIKGNYRRNLMDMHIDDWNPEFLSKINVKEYVEALKDAGVQAADGKGQAAYRIVLLSDKGRDGCTGDLKGMIFLVIW